MIPTNTPYKLTFVPYNEHFLECSYTWFQDPELRILTNNLSFVTRENQAEWFASLPSKSDYIIWGVELERVPIGACGLKKVTSSDAEYWGYIGEKQLWGQGFGKQMVQFCLGQANKLGLVRVWLTVNVENARAIALYTKMGFCMLKLDNGFLVMEMSIKSFSIN